MLWQYYRDEPASSDAGGIIDFPDAESNDDPFNFKQKITGQAGDDGKKDVEIIAPLKYLSHIWRTLEMPLINCEINLLPTWSTNCFKIVFTRTALTRTRTIN